MSIVQGQLVILATTIVPGVPERACGIVILADEETPVVHFRGREGPSTASLPTQFLEPYTGRCPACSQGEPIDPKARVLSCPLCHYSWIDPRWLYRGAELEGDGSAAEAIPELLDRVAVLEKAVQDAATLIENTTPETNAGLHQWLSRSVVRAARGLE